MSLVPETDYSPANRRPDHEKFLMVYLTLDEPKMLEEQKRFIRESRLVSPQDYTSIYFGKYGCYTFLLASSSSYCNRNEEGKIQEEEDRR
ncbi:unnamed protein product [Brassica oleracea var. botrytis]|uniref:Uncharacterized protein n=1 Tax=Brassica oleracea TaxID=3712 RepID=A0A3P6DGG0_BRAOL|nr:unnamed protein product [Brassica oleracea]